MHIVHNHPKNERTVSSDVQGADIACRHLVNSYVQKYEHMEMQKIKNRSASVATVLLIPRGVGFNKTNVFLIAPSYTKTPHECKGLQSSFGRGFFEGLVYLVANSLINLKGEMLRENRIEQ